MAEQILHIFVVFDRVANHVLGVSLHALDAVAIRAFLDAAKDPASMLNKYPQDYDLLRLGSVSHDNELVPQKIVVLSGAALAVHVADLKKEA